MEFSQEVAAVTEEHIASACSSCKRAMNAESVYCPSCGYPENGDENQRDRYWHSIKLKRDVLEDAEKKVNNVKVMLYIVAAINGLYGLFMLIGKNSLAEGLGGIIAAAIFIGCVIWVNKQPLTGILAGLSFYVLLILLAFALDPVSIFSGLLWKIVIVGIFIKGITAARDYTTYYNQLKELNAV